MPLSRHPRLFAWDCKMVSRMSGSILFLTSSVMSLVEKSAEQHSSEGEAADSALSSIQDGM
jgi:hypothetical protein